MSVSRSSSWVRAALFAALIYLVIGRVPTGTRPGRLLAWVASLVVFAIHVGYEHFTQRRSPRQTALHAAIAVAIGACGLAMYTAGRELVTTSSLRPIWFAAIVAFPAITGIPAFLAAFVAASILNWAQRKSDTATGGLMG